MSDEVESEVIPLDRLVKVYRKIYGKINDLTIEHESKVEGLKAQLEEVKNAVKDEMQRAGLKSVRTDFGTIILTQKTKYYTDDWDSFKQFAVEHDALDLFEKRIAQTNMAQFLEENPGVVPFGLNSMSEVSVSVRKPTK